jgi:hypothetical protein
MTALISTRSIILAAGLALALPAHAVDWNEMLRGVLGKPAGQPSASGVEALSNADINAGLKEALTRGADAAVAQLGQKDGFFGNPALKIPCRPACRKPKGPCACSAWAGRPTNWCCR